VTDPPYRATRWIGGHVRGLRAALGPFLVAGLALSAAAPGLFAVLAWWVSGDAVHRADLSVLLWLRERRSPTLDVLALAGAALGSDAALWITLAAGTAFLWRSRHRRSLLLLWISLLGARLLNQLLKAVFDRPRPRLVQGDLEVLGMHFAFPESPSFPSGHALTSAAVYGTLAFLVVRLEPTRRMRRATLAGAGLLILGIGFSRLYLGVHYPSDVIAGYLAGFAWATWCVLGVEALRRFGGRSREAREAERDLERGIAPPRDAIQGGDPGPERTGTREGPRGGR
jgi:undecaprenyl-diphosphatase